MSFHAQLLRDLDLGNDVSSYSYQTYDASSRPSVHNRNETPSWWKATLHFSAPVLLILAGIIYTLLHAYDLTWLSLTDLLWNYIVHFTPYKLIVIFDKETQAATFGASKVNPVSHAEKSAMMRRIIGLDKPGGLIHNVTAAGRRRLSSVVGLSGLGLRGGGSEDNANPAGLGNWDNSCYQNSVLQGLSSLKGFDNYLLGPNAAELQEEGSVASSDSDRTVLDESPGAEMQMANSLYNLIQKLNDPANNGGRLWTPAPLKNMSSWEQQDAQEYFSKILDAIDVEILRALDRRNPNAYGLPAVMKPGKLSYYGGRQWKGFKGNLECRNPLEGFLAQRVACTFCKYTDGLMMIPFCTLTLAIPSTPNKRVGVAYTISDLLDEYTKLEFIDGVHCGRCTLLRKRAETLFLLYEHPKFPEPARPSGLRNLAAVNEALEDEDYEAKTLKTKCLIPDHHMVDSTKSKQAVIARPPKSLVIHINRSMFDEHTGELRKNHSPVKFEEELDLGPWTLGSASSPSTRQKGVEGPDEEDWTTNPVRSMISRWTPNDPSGRNQLKNALAVNRGWNGGRLQADLPPKKSLVRGPVYVLRAMVVHQGRHENGHYITYKRFPVRVSPSPASSASSSPASAGSDEIEMQHIEEREPSQSSEDGENKVPEFEERWFRLSDDDVCQVESEDVFNYYSQQGAFMLFYDQISPAERVDAVSNPPDEGAWPVPATVPDDQCEPERLSAEDLKVAKLLEKYDENAKVDEISQKAWLEQLDILSADSGSIGSPATVIWDPRSPASAAGSGASGNSMASDASVVTAIWNPLPEHIEARKREKDELEDERMWERIERVAISALPSRMETKLAEILERTDAALTPPGPSSVATDKVEEVAQGTADELPAPVMPLRAGNAQNTVLSDIENQSPLVEASDSEMTSTAASSPQMKPLEPVVPIVIKPYAAKTGSSEMTERGGGGRRRNKKRKESGAGMLMV